MLNKRILLTDKYDKDKAAMLAQELKISPLVVGVLLNRGFEDAESIRTFLYGSDEPFCNPFLLKGMPRAVERIKQAIAENEEITVYGDYDVDGITASSLLYLFLKDLGAKVYAYIPVRKNEGYGLNTDAVEALFKRGTRLLVTVDCGISGISEVEAMPKEMDIVITDHHTPPEVLPAAYAIINPHQKGCQYPFKDLAGVGVAFKLCQALYKEYHPKEALWSEMLEFVAMGTVADIVPLIGENREIVKKGLLRMKNTQNIGLRELMKISGCMDKTVTAETIGFGLAPRLNAAGRLEHAMSAVELLVTDDREKATEIAQKLNRENMERQEISTQIFKEAEEMLKSQDRIKTAIVLAKEGWHAGVIGIVASRLVDKYYLPTILISIDGEIAKGSCRSIPTLNLYETIDACHEYLLQFGGHCQAAGLTLLTNNIDQFKERFKNEVSSRLQTTDYLPEIEADIIVPASQAITLRLMRELSLLEPYGARNPLPVFAFKDAKLRSPAVMGAEKSHLRVIVDFGKESYKGIMWNQAQKIDSIYNHCLANLAFSPKINSWNGTENIDLQLLAIGLKHEIFDYRNYYESKEALLKNILQKSEKTVVYVNKGLDLQFEPHLGVCEIVTYGNKQKTKDADKVVFYELPESNIFTAEAFPLPSGYEGGLYLLYNQNDYADWNSNSIIKYPSRKHLINEYKCLNELLRQRIVLNEKELLTKDMGVDCVISASGLRIFEELGFVTIANGQVSLKASKKNDLSNSKTFCALQDEFRHKLAICQQNMRVTAAQIADIWL